MAEGSPAARVESRPRAPELDVSSGLRQFLDQLLGRIAAALQAPRATLTRIEGEAVVIEGSHDADGHPAQLGVRWPITSDDVRRLIDSREPLLRTLDPATLPSPFSEQLADVRHMVMIPLVLEGEVFGTLTVSRTADRPFDSHDVATLVDLGGVAVLALRNALLLAQAQVAARHLQSSEERFRLLVEGVRDYAIFLLDPAGHVTTWNQGAERIKGYHADEIIGRHFSTFYSTDEVLRGVPMRLLQTAEREGRVEAEGWRIRKDGSRFWASVVITALRDESGSLRGFSKVTRDLTERKRVQDQLLEAERREAERFHELAERTAILERTKSEFLNLASHELRTPISLIRGYLSLFEEGDLGQLNERGRRAVDVLRSQARGLNSLVEQMLEAARMQIGNVALTPESTDLRVIAEDALDWARAAAGPDHRLVLVAPEEPVPVTGDPRRLRMVLHSLLDNAVKFSPEGGEILCTVRREGTLARVAVSDGGVGMDREQLAQLFTRFGRVVTGDTASVGGAGLGLYLARELARLHGGELEAESQPGQGSTFTLSLPAAPPRPAASPKGVDQPPLPVEPLATAPKA